MQGLQGHRLEVFVDDNSTVAALKEAAAQALKAVCDEFDIDLHGMTVSICICGASSVAGLVLIEEAKEADKKRIQPSRDLESAGTGDNTLDICAHMCFI